MILDASARLAAAATPSPSPVPNFNPDSVTPGLLGFLIIFLIAVATILLIVDMTRRIRRTRYRADVTAELDAEERRGAEEHPPEN